MELGLPRAALTARRSVRSSSGVDEVHVELSLLLALVLHTFPALQEEDDHPDCDEHPQNAGEYQRHLRRRTNDEIKRPLLGVASRIRYGDNGGVRNDGDPHSHWIARTYGHSEVEFLHVVVRAPESEVDRRE